MHADRRRVPRIGGWASFNLNKKWRENVLIFIQWEQFVIRVYKCTAFAAMRHIGHKASFLPQIAQLYLICCNKGTTWCQDACSTNRYRCAAFAGMRNNYLRASFLPQIAQFCQIWSKKGTICCQDTCSANRFRCAAFVAMRHICHKAPFPTNTIKRNGMARIGAGLGTL